MERCEDDIGVIPFQQYYAVNDFGLIDFMDEANLDQFIDLIRGDTNNQTHHDQSSFNFCNQDYDLQSNVIAAVDSHFLPPPVELFDFNAAAGHVAADDDDDDDGDYTEFGCQNQAGEEEILMDEDESSGSGTATTTPRGKKGGGKSDRSRTLVSERKRRGRMKEKLYALRSLVPNITKMDKASIVGDAVSYVQGLQMQAKKLRDEIAGLDDDSSLIRGDKHQHRAAQNGQKSNPLTCFYPTTKKIFKMDVSEVEERGFYVRIVAKREKGVAMLLHRALDESLTTFHVRTSNLAASADHNYVFTFTLHMMQGEMDVSLQSVKVWIATAFLNQGFEFQTTSHHNLHELITF